MDECPHEQLMPNEVCDKCRMGIMLQVPPRGGGEHSKSTNLECNSCGHRGHILIRIGESSLREYTYTEVTQDEGNLG